MPYIFFLLICATWGSSFILMKKANLAFSPLEVAAWRVCGGAITLAMLCWAQKNVRWPRAGEWGWLLLVVVCGFAWPYAIQPYLVSLHGSAFVGMSVSFVPLLTILVSIPVLRVYPTTRQVCGVLGAWLGLTVLVKDSLERSIPVRDLLLAGTVPLGYSFCNTIIRRWLSGTSSALLTMQALALSSAILLPLAGLQLGPQPTQRSDWLLASGALMVLGVVGTGIATWLFTKLIQEQGPLFAGMATNLIPLGAILWGWVDHEPVSGQQLGAMLFIVCMVLLVQFGAGRAVIKR